MGRVSSVESRVDRDREKDMRTIAVFALWAVLFAFCSSAEAQQTGKVFRIGYLDPSTASGEAGLVNAFRQELSKLGWIEGKNFTIEYRFAEQKPDRLPELAAELVGLKVDLIVVAGTPSALAAKNATAHIPVVMATVADAVGAGVVASLARPGGNVTGLTSLGNELNTKRLEVLKDAVPKLVRVGVLRPPGGQDPQLQELRAAALGLQLKLEAIDTPLDANGAYPYEGVDIRFAPNGTVVVVTATQSSGQGHETSFAQLVSERLGVPFDKVRIKEGDSSDLPKGLASVGSRSMIMAGSAIAIASDAVIEKGRALASHVLEVSRADLEFRDGSFYVQGTDIAISLLDLAMRVRSLRDLPADVPATLNSTGEFTAPGLHHPNGCHVCEVEIDPETGKVNVVAYCAVDDVGTVINPLIVHGQVHGGVAQGIGQVLLERIVYDDDGQLITGSLMDYGLPRAANLPTLSVDFHPTPSTKNPIGVKGSGEVGVTGSIPAVLNAVNDALARVGASAEISMPVTSEKVWRYLRDVSVPKVKRRRAPKQTSL